MTATLPAVPTTDIDPFTDEALADPWPVHAALRDAGPVVYLNRHGVYAMARYHEVHDALVNWQGFQSGAGVGMANFRTEKPWRPPSLLLEADPPHHDAPRVVLAKILGPRALRSLRDRWFADAETLIDEVLQDAETRQDNVFDAVRAISEAFPLRVFPDAVGLPMDGREHLLPYGNHLFNTFGPHNDLVRAGEPSAPAVAGWVNSVCARDVLDHRGFGAQIWAAADHGDITYEQAPLVVRSLLSAGVDTTVHALSAVLYSLATHPEAWQRLRADPRLARLAFEESMRWQSPVQTFFRTATADIDLGGVRIPDGEKILMFLAGANRDPRHWDNPDAYDLGRDPSGHLGFGFGLHQCVGQHIARLEAEAVLTALATRVSAIELAGEGRRHLNNTLRCWESLPVRVRLE